MLVHAVCGRLAYLAAPAHAWKCAQAALLVPALAAAVLVKPPASSAHTAWRFWQQQHQQHQPVVHVEVHNLQRKPSVPQSVFTMRSVVELGYLWIVDRSCPPTCVLLHSHMSQAIVPSNSSLTAALNMLTALVLVFLDAWLLGSGKFNFWLFGRLALLTKALHVDPGGTFSLATVCSQCN